MKKIIAMFIGFLLLAGGAMAQDSTYYQHHPQKLLQAKQLKKEKLLNSQEQRKVISNTRTPEVSQYQFPPAQPYRDTRLGSSSPLYNTYAKNKYGAGAVTNNPNKWGSGVLPIKENVKTYQSRLLLSPKKRSAIFRGKATAPQPYRDTRLGSSSPLYNTYIKNKYGTGAITTNPNKGRSRAPATTYPTAQNHQERVDTLAHQ